MPARVQVVVEAKDAAGGVLRAITGQMGALGGMVEELTAKNISWGNVAQQAATMVIDGFKESINATMEYAESVRDLSLISGQSAEETSRFLQVLDDFQLGAEDAEAATRKLTQNGLVPNVATLAQLSDQYLAINDAQERNEFIIKNLGRSGLQWVNVLQQGSDKILQLNDSVNKNLILTDEQVQKTEEYRLAVDNLSDSWEAAKIAVGTDAIPFLVSALDAFDNSEKELALSLGLTGREADRFAASLLSMKNETNSATESYTAMAKQFTESAASIQNDATMTAEEMKKLADETTNFYKGLISDIQSAQSETNRYVEVQQEASAAIAQADADLQKGAISLSEHDKILADNTSKLKENEEAHRRWAAQTVFAFAQARAAADGEITEGEGEILIQAGEQLGLFDEQTADTMRSVNEAFDSLDTENAQDVVQALHDSLMELTGQDWVVNIVTATNGTVPTAPNSSGSPDERAIGGEVYAGNAYTVGESGREPFFPAVNGRILGHSEALHAMSLGAGGGSYNFYGNVTLTIGADSAAGLMEMR